MNNSQEDNKSREQSIEKDIKRINNKILIIAVIAIAVIVFTAVYYIKINNLSKQQVPITQFIEGYHAANRLSIVIYYSNYTQLAKEINCETLLIESITGSKNQLVHLFPQDLYLYVINSTSCSYSLNGTYGAINLVNTTAESCMQQYTKHPYIFINFSNTKSNVSIYASSVYIEANSSYLASCPIAEEI
ncbi:MAG: hypothetical protein ARM1_0039 [Candidatus Micrarchaeota archaeon]|nr:MAG: hypothetical protein ARM1_0039 [Candidatus Micrarchaeota archaeon]